MFDLKNNIVVISPEELAIPFINSVWVLDKSKDKSIAFKELSYIYYMYNHKSPYVLAGYSEDQRREKVIQDIIKDKKWKISSTLQEAIVCYKERISTLSTELLESAKTVIGKLKDYFDNVDFKEMKFDKNGNEVPAYEAKDVISNLANLGKIVDSVNILEEKVKKEVTQNNSVRGNRQVSLYED